MMDRFVVAALVALASYSAGCGGKDSAPVTLTGIRVSPEAPTITAGEALQLTVLGAYSDGHTAPLAAVPTWSATDPVSTAIDSAGVVTGLASGVQARSSTIGVTAAGFSASTRITVRAALDATLAQPGDYPRAEAPTDGNGRLFELAGLEPGQAYELPVTGLTAGSHVDFSLFGDRGCRIGIGWGRVGDPDPIRFLANAEGKAYVALKTFPGWPFTIGEPTAYAGPPLTATLAYPASFTYSQASLAGSLHYAITGLAPGAAYSVTFSNAPVGYDGYAIAAYADRTFLDPVCDSGWSGSDAGNSCSAVASPSGEAFVKVYSQLSYVGAFTLDVAVRPAVTVAATLGESSFPLQASLPASERRWYRVGGLAPGAEYLLVVSGTQRGAIYDDDHAAIKLGGSIDWHAAPEGTSTWDFRAPDDGEVYVGLFDDDGSTGPLTLDLLNLEQEIVSLPFSHGMTVTGSVNGGAAIYAINGVESLRTYSVTLSDLSADADLYVSPSPWSDLGVCASRLGATADESCSTGTGEARTIYVLVDGAKAPGGASFTLGATYWRPPWEQVAYEGGIPFSGVAGADHRYLEVTGLPASWHSAYLDLQAATGVSEFDVYADPFMNERLCFGTSHATGVRCATDGTIVGGTVYLDLSWFTASVGTTYSLWAYEKPWTTYRRFGTAELPHSDHVGANAVREYVVTGLAPGTAYTVTLSGMTEDVDLFVKVIEGANCSSSVSGTGDESCVVTTSYGSVTVQVGASTFPAAATDFTLDVQ